MKAEIRIIVDDLSSAPTRDLLRLHLEAMRANSPPGTSFALDLTHLQSPRITVWTGWAGPRIAGIGALKELDDKCGEIKSMRTHPDFLRQGVGLQLLEHIIRIAQERGMRRLSLETGTGPLFEPALGLYRQRGFRNGPAFAGYPANSSFNQFLHLELPSNRPPASRIDMR